ncbi:RNA polymerase sigma factor [Sphingobacterium psychroaquaticum]|uniref:RNA polymerase sigma-70 factor, ECF subfamily n=1 Tax=Sphingobacterium psychroaquaticum TaxID=561061 RepID=A0A1X7K2D2_9SPHI|nr:RNA polymerase sigma-70 factor [Sphingobacterium psychroaquaticum]QBQ42555.1 RNA polymerase sigma-70 factor [Sphingobacterium psychroaquaticum]SMG34698.1 RNA polymerase sigma-70 factor, ECF subfamily [Sphingobacterium psychroaquaticum]
MDIAKYIACSDEQLFLLIKEGDHTAYRILYERFFPILYAHATKKVPDNELAKDILQDVFVKLWTAAPTLDVKGKISNYLYGATRNTIINYYVSSTKVQDHMAVFTLYQNQVDNSVIDNLQLKELQALIEKEVGALPEKMRDIFNLSRKQQLSHKEIADLLNLSELTVKKQVANALKILKKKINYHLLLTILF